MRTAFITTVRHNVGDDFVREGLTYLLRQVFEGEAVEFSSIHKHAPISVRRGFEWVRRKELSRALDWIPLRTSSDRVLACDLLVQSGAPVYWCHAESRCSDNEWYGPLIRRRYERVRQRVPLLNLAAGTCQPYHSDGREFRADERVARYVRDFHDRATLTTVRDRLSREILQSLGRDAPVIPCSSIFARDALGIEPGEPRYLALNFMPLGGHYDLAQNVKRERWREAFRSFYREVRERIPCILVCHDRRELASARSLDPEARIFFSHDHRDYLRLYAHAVAGVMNRVHGAFAIASFGRPAFVIGNDTRSHMADQIHLRHAYVEDVDAERLLAELDHCLSGTEEHAARLAGIRQAAWRAYHEVLAPVRERLAP
jgi:hypothetical protein